MRKALPPLADRVKAAQARLDAVAKLEDWYAFCPKCGKRIEGSVAGLKVHACEEPDCG